jgi:hypothetical protein
MMPTDDDGTVNAVDVERPTDDELMIVAAITGERVDTVYCPLHLRLEPATIDRDHGQHPVLWGAGVGVIIARAVLACGLGLSVVTTRERAA